MRICQPCLRSIGRVASLPLTLGLVLSLCTPEPSAAQGRRPKASQTAATKSELSPGGAGLKVDESHPLAPLLERAYESRKALDAVQDYEAVFAKREVVGRKLLKSTLQIRLREEPFSVYLKFLDTGNKGREVLFVAGTNAGKIMVHEEGISRSLLGTMNFLPDDRTVMAENRYPITMVGMRTLVDTVIKQWEAEGQFGEVDVQFRPASKLEGRNCDVLESSHPQPRNQFKYHLTRLWIDGETRFPVRVEQYDFPARAGDQPPLVEEYTYTKIKVNAGLTNRDFDKANPAYRFP